MLVSIIVPAYKQEKTIKKDIENIDSILGQTRWDYEIIVVVDGFLDKTFQEIKKIKSKKVNAVGYETNHGKGYAVRYGMARSSGDLVAFIDAGMDLDPNGISMLLEHMEWYGADIMVGSKRHPVSKVSYPFIRRIYSWGYHKLVRMLFGLKIRDTQTGLKIYRRKVLEKVLPRLLIKEFAFDIELLAVARRLGFAKIYEAPVRLDLDFSNSTFTAKLIFDKSIQRMIVDTLAVFYRMHILKYYDNESKRKWTYDPELEFRINTGEFSRK